MNFLAHAVLAGCSEDRIAGSLAGDFVKGVLHEQAYPAEFMRGLRLHRRIDAFSNRNHFLRRSADRLPAELRRIAPPCIDMMADHFLAESAAADPQLYLPVPKKFPHAGLSLKHYETMLHEAIKPHLELLSPEARRFFHHAESTALFSSYQSFDRVARGVSYVCERLGHASETPSVLGALTANREGLYNDFLNYWPALNRESERFLAS